MLRISWTFDIYSYHSVSSESTREQDNPHTHACKRYPNNPLEGSGITKLNNVTINVAESSPRGSRAKLCLITGATATGARDIDSRIGGGDRGLLISRVWCGKPIGFVGLCGSRVRVRNTRQTPPPPASCPTPRGLLVRGLGRGGVAARTRKSELWKWTSDGVTQRATATVSL